MTCTDHANFAERAERVDVNARLYEAGRRRGLAECPCGSNPGAADLLTYEDGYDAGVLAGAGRALLALLALAIGAAWMGRGRR